MSKKIEDRWFKWDVMINEGKNYEVVGEFDRMVKNGDRVLIGDLIRRNQALDLVGVTPMESTKIKIVKAK